jgi:hypothetical protein
MCCILCHKNAVIAMNPRTQARKGLTIYYKTNGITFFKKHVDVVHMFIAKKFEKKMNNLVKQTKEIHLPKKGNIIRRSIFKFFYCEGFFTKKNVPQKEFLLDLGL